MTTKSKNNHFLFHNHNSELIKNTERRLICRDCAYWRSDKKRMNGYCSRTKKKTTLIDRCYQTFEEMYGHEIY